MKLRRSQVVLLFLLGAAAGLVGDRIHIATGSTEYFETARHHRPRARIPAGALLGELCVKDADVSAVQ